MKWINVNDRLPGHSRPVLVASKNREYTVAIKNVNYYSTWEVAEQMLLYGPGYEQLDFDEEIEWWSEIEIEPTSKGDDTKEPQTDTTKELSRQMRVLLEEYARKTGAMVTDMGVKWFEDVSGGVVLDKFDFRVTTR